MQMEKELYFCFSDGSGTNISYKSAITLKRMILDSW